MRSEIFWLNAIFASVGGFAGWFLGEPDSFLYALISFIVVDFITVFLCGLHDKKLSSRIGSKIIYGKVMIFLLVGIANLIDRNMFGENGAIRTAVIFFYLANEGVSILENAVYLGLPIPEKLKNVMLGLQSDKLDEYDRYASDEEDEFPDDYKH